MLTSHRARATHGRPAGSGHAYQYDGYPQGAASPGVNVTPITVLQEVPNRQPRTTNSRRWVDPTLEQGVGRDPTFANGWMKRAYVINLGRDAHYGGRWPTGPRAMQAKQHRPGTGPVLLAARVHSGSMVQRGGTLPAPVTVMRTVSGGEPL